jgi:hypothetical protein
MDQNSENFDSLRQLLALKRHEQPPPGYFNRFSRDVMARIKAGESGGAVGSEFSWWQRFLSVFDVKPVFAGAFGTAVCAFLISGVLSSETPVAGGSLAVVGGGTSPSVDTPSVATATPVDLSTPVTAQMMAASTNSGSLFDQFSLQTAPTRASYLIPGPN